MNKLNLIDKTRNIINCNDQKYNDNDNDTDNDNDNNNDNENKQKKFFFNDI